MEIKRKKIRNENRKKKEENIGNKENTKDQEIKLKKKKPEERTKYHSYSKHTECKSYD